VIFTSGSEQASFKCCAVRLGQMIPAELHTSHGH
jgi:hypothetical protein